METDALPEVGHELNIVALARLGILPGLHRVTAVEDDFQWQGHSHIRIDVERIGDLMPDLMMHLAYPSTC